MYRKLSLILSLLLFFAVSMQAQTAHSLCMDEIKAAYASIDHEALLKSDKVSRIEYQIAYMVAADPDKTVRRANESWLLTKGQSHHISEDMHIYTDGEKSYNYRPHQFVIYCANSSLGTEGVIKNVDAGIWDHVEILSCEFTNEGAYKVGEETITPKEMMLVVDEEGQKKYSVTAMTVVIDPVKEQLMRISLDYIGKVLYSTADYNFTTITNDYSPEKPLGKLDEIFLDETGKLKTGYTGCRLIDVRN